MSKFFMMIGLPGSGKSTFANKLAKEEKAKIFSSDELRRELYGDINNQEHNTDLFNELNKRVTSQLKANKNVIYDATNISYKSRRGILSQIRNISCEKIAIFIATPYSECCNRNAARERVVPNDVIKRMYMSFDTPCMNEGFTSIRVVYPNNVKFNNYSELLNKFDRINQDNPHHSSTIGGHMRNAYQYFIEKYEAFCEFDSELSYAILLHDIGKPFTKVFHNSKGVETEDAHYYNHQHVGAYDIFLTNVPEDMKITISLLINYHMQYYVSWNNSERAKEKDKCFLGDNLFSMLEVLHDCDMNAH